MNLRAEVFLQALKRALLELDEVAQILSSCERDALPQMGADALGQWAVRRSQLHDALRASEARVLACVNEAAATVGRAPTLASLESVSPSLVLSIRARLAEMKTKAAKLSARDAERNSFLNCARALVRGYLAIISPPARAYGPSGGTTPSPVPATTMSRA
jgi:hypothetical protein